MVVAETMKKSVFAIPMEVIGVMLCTISSGAMLTSFAMLIFDSAVAGRDYFMSLSGASAISYGLFFLASSDNLKAARENIFTTPEGAKPDPETMYALKFWGRKKQQLKLQKIFTWLKGDGGDELEERKNNDTRTWDLKKKQMEKMRTGADVTQGTDKLLRWTKRAMKAVAFKKAFKKDPLGGLGTLLR